MDYEATMGKQASAVLYVLAMVAVVVGVDLPQRPPTQLHSKVGSHARRVGARLRSHGGAGPSGPHAIPVSRSCRWSARASAALTLAEPRRLCTTTPGVYLFKQESALVYVGRAGERSGKGLRGRLTIYVSGRAPQSGFGNLALE